MYKYSISFLFISLPPNSCIVSLFLNENSINAWNDFWLSTIPSSPINPLASALLFLFICVWENC